ncbi:acyl carrier protein [Serratia marcescens]|uniref:acyl carrier protein n=1 Tax=Serratia marcescens TaxID=615 RepID=UPI001C571CEB|nr:acyl carrier protein [Serratia marcescens]QXX95814.1 acyl carrier protein [Serratia marcescens]
MSGNVPQTQIIDLILTRLAAQTRLPKASIDIQSPLANYGVDSIHALSLCAELEERLGIEIEPTIAWDYPTIEQMAEFLESEMASASR